MPTITFNGANGTMCTVACENDASVRFSTDDNVITVVITSIRNAEAEAEGKVDADAGESERQEVDEPSVDFEQVLFEVAEQLGRCVAVLARRMREEKCIE